MNRVRPLTTWGIGRSALRSSSPFDRNGASPIINAVLLATVILSGYDLFAGSIQERVGWFIPERVIGLSR